GKDIDEIKYECCNHYEPNHYPSHDLPFQYVITVLQLIHHFSYSSGKGGVVMIIVIVAFAERGLSV
ncbi:unnamed protein product, partial [marine sediment metagenome]